MNPVGQAALARESLTLENVMPKFVIERDMPGAGALSPAQLKEASRASRDVLEQMGPQIEWVESYVTDDRIYCVYTAPDAATIRRHAEAAHLPADRISEVRAVIDPSTADAAA